MRPCWGQGKLPSKLSSFHRFGWPDTDRKQGRNQLLTGIRVQLRAHLRSNGASESLEAHQDLRDESRLNRDRGILDVSQQPCARAGLPRPRPLGPIARHCRSSRHYRARGLPSHHRARARWGYQPYARGTPQSLHDPHLGSAPAPSRVQPDGGKLARIASRARRSEAPCAREFETLARSVAGAPEQRGDSPAPVACRQGSPQAIDSFTVRLDSRKRVRWTRKRTRRARRVPRTIRRLLRGGKGRRSTRSLR
jgi:hypothetical protein